MVTFGPSMPSQKQTGIGYRVLALLAIIAGFNPILAVENPIGLEWVLKNTLSKNGQIKESEQDIEIARQQLERANAALFPTGSALFLAAPIFEERGNALRSTSNWNRWGPFLKTGFQLIQPIYTFGQIGGYRDAAENQIVAYEGLTEMKRAEMVLTAKEFYYGYLMATALDSLVQDLTEFLDEAVQTAEKKRSRKDSTVKPHDLYKLKTALDDLRQKKLLAVQSRKTAERAVEWISGSTFEALGKMPLEPEPFEKKSLDDYLKLARANRPEFQALRAGQQARESLGKAKRAQSYPVIFVGGYASYGWSPVRDYQPSIYANDPFNRLEGGVGVGLKVDLEFKRHTAEAAEQAAEAMKLKAKESYASPGIELEVKRAFWELEQAIEGLDIAKDRKTLSKKWFVSNAMGWSIGVVEAKDLLESLEGDGLAKKNYIETVYSLNMSLARLSKAVGKEITSLKYGK